MKRKILYRTMLNSVLITFLFYSTLSCKRKSEIAQLPSDSHSQDPQTHTKHHGQISQQTLIPNPHNQALDSSKKTTAEDSPSSSDPATIPVPNLTTSEEVKVNSLPATVMGIHTSQISFRISGYISDVIVKNGQFVKKGQVIAKLDNNIALQNLNLSKYSLEQSETSAHFAELALKRAQTLNQKQATTQTALEQAQLGFENAQIAVKQAQANLKLSQINYDETNLIAPFDGYIFGLNAWIGTYVSSTTVIGTLSSINDLQIQIPVPQTVKNHFTEGQEFAFSNASQVNEGTLKITSIVPYVDPISKTYIIYAIPIKMNSQLMPGELIQVNIN